MTRNEVTELIILQKMTKQLTWPQLADAIGLSKEWTTAALLGQMTLTVEQATTIGTMLDLPDRGDCTTTGCSLQRIAANVDTD